LKKKFFSRTSRLISIKPETNRPWVKKILNCANKRPGPLQRGDNHKNGVGVIQKFSQELLSQKSSYLLESFVIYMQYRFTIGHIMAPGDQEGSQ
jgi:hypothetical protein